MKQIKIRIQLFGILTEHLPSADKGKGIVELEKDSTVKELLKKLGIKRNVTIAINEEHDLDKDEKLKDDDEVMLFTSVSGG